MSANSFPRQSARTQRFTLGAPRAFTIAPTGDHVAFLRSRAGDDRETCLWCLELASAEERLVADPVALLAGSAEQLSVQERARRERARQGAAGIVGYAEDGAATTAAFALSGRVFLADLVSGGARELPTETPAIDPRPDPTGAQVAYVAAGALRVVGADGVDDRAVAEPDADGVTWGLAEFVAAEEMERFRGYWWSPDGGRLLAARVDESPVQRWHVADPARPEVLPVELAYPAAGTANADVSLALVELDGSSLAVRWDRTGFPYLITVSWTSYGAPLVLVMSRDQRTSQVLEVDPETGSTSLLREEGDERWVDVVPGVPTWLPDGRLLTTVDDRDTRRLAVDGGPVTPVGLQVDSVIDVDESGVLFAATGDPTEMHVWRLDPDGTAAPVTRAPGVHSGRRAGAVTVVASASLEWPGTRVTVHRDGAEVAAITSYAETPVVTPTASLLTVAERRLRTALVLPTGHRPGSRRLPVLLDPYGGPHVLQVRRARSLFLERQWWADQGFAVIVCDGRGTPGRGPAWERAIAFDVAGPVLEDQVDALHAVAAEHADLDLERVAIRGWSFGGYLAALAVLRRPDVFAAAVAGAPCTDWGLYDTFYTERYLGHPDEHPEVYTETSLLADAPKLERPLMLVHGLADDNVVAAHTLQLSAALLAAGRPHTVLPLSGVTHMTPQEVVAENLLLLQLDFLRRSLPD